MLCTIYSNSSDSDLRSYYYQATHGVVLMKDTLNKPIEYICATYSTEGLQKLIPTLKDPYNIVAIYDELTQRLLAERREEDADE